MIDPTIYTLYSFTAAELARRDVEKKREGAEIILHGSGVTLEQAQAIAAHRFPMPQPTRSLREASEGVSANAWRFRFFGNRIEARNDANPTWGLVGDFTASRGRVTLWHDLMMYPWQCDGCGAPLASETEEHHQCP